MPTTSDFRSALVSIDMTRPPSGSLGRRLHLAFEAVAEAENAGTDRLVTALLTLRRALTALEEHDLGALSGAEIVELAARVDALRGLLETPDLREVATEELPRRFRELYSAIVRLRAMFVRLRTAWRDGRTRPP